MVWVRFAACCCSPDVLCCEGAEVLVLGKEGQALTTGGDKNTGTEILGTGRGFPHSIESEVGRGQPVSLPSAA